MSRIQLANHSVNRTIKRKKFPHVLQVHEKLGPREQRTTALENNRSRPPPRTPQRKNQPSRLQPKGQKKRPEGTKKKKKQQEKTLLEQGGRTQKNQQNASKNK